MNGYAKLIRDSWARLSQRLLGNAANDASTSDLHSAVALAERAIVPERAMAPLNQVFSFRHNLSDRSPLPIQLSIHTLDSVVRELVPFFGENCPVRVIYNKRTHQTVHPTEVVQATLSTIHSVPDYTPHTRSAFILVG